MPPFRKVTWPKLLSFLLLFVTLVTGIAIGLIVNTGVKANHQAPPTGAADAAPLKIPQAVPIANEFTKLTKRVEPSVVYIESDYLPKAGKHVSKSKKDDGSDETDGEEDPSAKKREPSDLFKRFFGNNNEQRTFRTEGTGTGFVVDKNGYILTNYHVVENADKVKVRLAGEEIDYRGRLVGYDTETDLAVLKIDSKQSLAPVEIGNSDSVQVGDWVIAIGSPFGLQATVTAGIISAERTSRDLPGAKQFQNFLQTDAAINPGNSGGPLLNIRGEVIGVNTMIATRSGSYEGIGFALPSNMAVKVYNDIILHGRVVRGSLGIRWSRNGSQSDTLQAFGLDHGVLVESVNPAGPANKAGIKSDDIITSINEKPIKDGQELVTQVAELPVGSNALLTVDRNGKKIDFRVAVADRSVLWQNESPITAASPVETPAPSQAPHSVTPAKFGITIMRLTERERKDLAIDDKTGVKVVSVDSGSFADDIGIVEGDTILAINRNAVSSPEDIIRLQSGIKVGQPVAVRIIRGHTQGESGEPQRLYLSGRLPEN